MADDSQKMDVTDNDSNAQQIQTTPREDMIATAAKFLQNPKVKTSPLQLRRNFLEKKGLTPQEIDMALQRSESMAITLPQVPKMVTYNHIQPPVTRWATLREVCSVAFVFGATAYGIYQLWKNFLKPYFFGTPTDEERIAKLEASVNSMATSLESTVAQLQKSLQEVTSVLNQILQKHDLIVQISRKERNADGFQYQELKSEITSLKGLLLNRRQFPPTPATTPVIPTWQLANKSNSGLNGDVSAESVPAKNTTTTRQTEAEADGNDEVNADRGIRRVPSPINYLGEDPV